MWLLQILAQLQKRDAPPPSPVNQDELRFEMTLTDPDYASVRDIQHDALQVLAAKRGDEKADREFRNLERRVRALGIEVDVERTRRPRGDS